MQQTVYIFDVSTNPLRNTLSLSIIFRNLCARSAAAIVKKGCWVFRVITKIVVFKGSEWFEDRVNTCYFNDMHSVMENVQQVKVFEFFVFKIFGPYFFQIFGK